MHLTTAALLISTFWMTNCWDAIYPVNFMFLVMVILLHQGYDIHLARHGYMVDYENLPPMKRNKLKYNKDLFQHQTKVLMIGNISFGVLSMLTVATGYFILAREHHTGTKQHLLCVNGSEWILLSPVGQIFGVAHQLLVLMQINITQYVLVRAPDNRGVFNKDMMNDLGHQLRKNLLAKAEEYRKE